MSKAPSTPPDNRPPAKSTPSLSNPNVVFSTPDDVNKEEQCGKKSAKSVWKADPHIVSDLEFFLALDVAIFRRILMF